MSQFLVIFIESCALLKGSYCLLLETTYTVPNIIQGANSKTKLSNSNLGIFNQISMLARLPPPSIKEPLLRVHQAPLTIGIFCSPLWCVLTNGFLLLVGASLPRIENILAITKLKPNDFVFELAPSMAFDTKYVFSRRRQQAL